MTQTPKEKAVELVDNYLMLVGGDWNGSAKGKKLAIIAVDEILNLECIEVYDLKKHIPNLPDEFVRLEVKKLETGHVRYEVTAWSNDYSDNTDMAL